jgi:hypothetical protein
MTISLTVNMWHKTIKVEALLDCGATHNFIDPKTISSLNMGTRLLPQPLIVRNVDGTINSDGTITRYCNLWVRRGNREERLGFYVANLGRDRIILGYPWFKLYNPTFNWQHNTLQGEDVEIDTAGYRSKQTRIHALHLPPNELSKERAETLQLIPPQYGKYWEVFSEKAARHFPPSRPDDHAIVLKPGAPDTLDCKIYRQTEEELQVTKEFIDNGLAKGYLRESKSPYASPMFYRAKQDGKLRPIIDYRALNALTIRDVYPLPLIGSIIDKLQGKTLFSKMDLRWGFNNIQIKEEDRWKAAFKTPFRAYETLVMLFGLTNSPPTFCHAMERMLRHLMRKYPTELFVYVDDILVATSGEIPRHRQIVREVLEVLVKESYFLWPAKCTFEQTSVTYLGIIVDGNKLSPDPKKTSALREWPRTLDTVKQVRSILGILGYQRPFIPNYANIARPLVALTKKAQVFTWTEDCTKALNMLINIILDNPSVLQPDLTKPFSLQVDASAFATGAILMQKDERGKHLAVGFHSQTFNEAKRNYDIHDRELLAVYRGLTHYRHLLLSSPFPTMVLTDHKNLEYYRHPRHINRRIARYVQLLADYNFQLVHIPGSTNKADALSRRPDYDDGSDDNSDVTVLPPNRFIQSTTLSCLFLQATTLSTIDDRAKAHQLRQPKLLKRWSNTYPIKQQEQLFWYGDRLVIVDDTSLKRGVISLYHDSTTAGHPGISNTTWAIARDYWWPALMKDITEYIKGCSTCQSRKNQPNKPKPPLFPISSDMYRTPFTSIAMDFIVKLPISKTYETILTITDTFSKASIFIPCDKTIDATGVAQLYANYVLPHYGLPLRIILDRDPHFTSSFFRELCRVVGAVQNLSTAYRPQTDGQSERTNQRLEQYIRIFTIFEQTNWADLLVLAQYTLNSWPNATTKKAPYELLLGYIPRVHQTIRAQNNPKLEERLQRLTIAREEVAEALKRAANIQIPSRFEPYQKGDK